MKRLIIVTSAALIAIGISGAAFAQTGANPSAPHPNSTGTATETPGMTSTGTAVDKSHTGGTTGMNAKKSGSETGNSATSVGGSNNANSMSGAEGRTSGGGAGAGGAGGGAGSK